ncbi:MAG: hypothetical protein KR126chlam2_00609 [Chlamydiae bacterium]|nr:hypothetical protein [Chlamydiota bacterium]
MKKLLLALLLCLSLSGYAAEKEYTYIFFYKTDDAEKKQMEKVFDSAVEQVKEKVKAKKVDIDDKSGKVLVEKYDLQKAPMPFVMVFAPNGAITGAFVAPLNSQELTQAFVSPTTEEILQPLQEGKFVFLMVQNSKTKKNQEALKGVNEFQADSKYRDATEIITLDPSNSQESELLEKIEVDPKTKEAVTVFFLPPGEMVGKFTGATSKVEIESTLQQALSEMNRARTE